VILVPVLDLKGGEVVHARSGRRDEYRPVRSRLCPGADAAGIAQALLRLHPFRAIYVADLDRIEGREDNDAAVAAVRAAVRSVEIWVDGGVRSASDLAALRCKGLGVPVIGSESLAVSADPRAVLDAAGPDAILSLDFLEDRFLGPSWLLAESSLWPRRLIVMELARVGARQGPDLVRLAAIVGRAGKRLVFAAGGVRDLADLGSLSKAGAAGALLATALHTGVLSAAELAEFDEGDADLARLS
jgi:phosphoribosylformimino-5-aminoimidazole carboxamide ribotide isomerase